MKEPSNLLPRMMQIFSAAFSFSNFLKYLIVKKEVMKKRPFQFK